MDKLKMRIQEKSHEMDIDQPSASTWENLKSKLNSTENDPLKNHIAINGEELEIETPDLRTWEKIEQSMAAKPKVIPMIRKRMVYLSAACILLIIALGTVRYINMAPAKQDQAVVAKPPKNVLPAIDSINHEPKNEVVTLPAAAHPAPVKNIKKGNKTVAFKAVKKEERQSLPPELMQMQKDYEALIAGQINYTKHLAVYGESADYFERFMNDFKLLDKQEKELRLLILQNGLQENSIDDLAMIYQQKLTVLKKLQNEINKTSNRNKNLTDTIPTYISL